MPKLYLYLQTNQSQVNSSTLLLWKKTKQKQINKSGPLDYSFFHIKCMSGNKKIATFCVCCSSQHITTTRTLHLLPIFFQCTITGRVKVVHKYTAGFEMQQMKDDTESRLLLMVRTFSGDA